MREMAVPSTVTGITEIDVQLATPSHCIVLHAASSMALDSITVVQLQPEPAPGGPGANVTGAGIEPSTGAQALLLRK